MLRRACLGLLLAVSLLGCEPTTSEESLSGATGQLVIYSTTDEAAFEPVVADFSKAYPGVRIAYVELQAFELDRRFRDEMASAKPSADLLLSSAMDLQIKLANDGYAKPHISASAKSLPSWARWRDEAFGFSFEPLVMVINRKELAGRPIPRSRQQLVATIRSEPDFWQNRIGTYDPSQSSVGYFVMSQDARHSSDFASMAEAFRDVGIVTAQTSSAILDQVESGRLIVGYNILGSYARTREARDPNIEIVYPGEYTLAVTRTAIIPANAAHSKAAHLFLEYLLSIRGQRILTSRSSLSSVRPEIENQYSHLGIAESTVGPLKPISLSPGLLVYLDAAKRKKLMETWSGSQN
ncbi:iron(III) transport system substrate-binding protein [Novosphingobium kunmingense]|uniref:Iron(III) transport system substrate-binding protein n=1 Tax=Novosphingobium kunmingense TaxID=1211806 RepID=A0A2N0HJA6_9SPHN|nr:ABC transporter substrate-binding protein [Novosphingobium kunmingense]PKB19022.1 iron(III) transport system substrate-binding protein [Novosphingobium kunmingense]